MLWIEKTSLISLSGLLLTSQALTLEDAVTVLQVHSCTSHLACLVFLLCRNSVYSLPMAVASY